VPKKRTARSAACKRQRTGHCEEDNRRRGAETCGALFARGGRADSFVFVVGQGPVNTETGEVPDAFADQLRQALAFGPFSRVSALTLEPRSVRARPRTEKGSSSVSGDQEGSAEGSWDGLRRAIPSPGAILRGCWMLRGESPVGL
jgi:hypothetical protein